MSRPSRRRFAAVFGSALVAANLGQLVWLMLGSRAMTRDAFGTVLAAQALYVALQLVVDNGPGFHGARLAATGRLAPDVHASLVRVRLQLALGAAAVAVGFGVLGGRNALLAIAPFTVALVLFAFFGYWERFGLGESGPWSAYLVLRAFLPAIAAGVCLVGSAEFPLVLAGTMECTAIVAATVFLRLRPRIGLVAALTARPGPWRAIATVGLPAVLWQIGLSSGTVLLSSFGAAAAAAVLGVAVRLLTGLNQLSGVVVTALFPEVAAGQHEDRSIDERAGAALEIGVRIALVLAATANAVFFTAPALVLGLFLPDPGNDAEQVGLIVISCAVATCFVVSTSIILIARGSEILSLRAIFAGSTIVAAGGLAVALISPRSVGQWMAAAFSIGQMATVVVLAVGLVRLLPSTRRLQEGMTLAAGAFAVAGILGALVPAVRAPLALGMAILAVSTVGSKWRDIRRAVRAMT